MIQSVKVKNLSLSNDNVRKTNRDADLESLAANIASQGLLQNLVVTPLKKKDTFTVKAGGRRLRALQLLIKDGTLPDNFEVPAMVLDDDTVSVEASLSENFHRVPMNPADECTAFKFFIDKGTSAEDVAKRFGVTTRFVEQRVRLAELAPCVFEALADGTITLGVAQAYAVVNDVDRQARVFEQMNTSYYGDNPDTVKRALLNGSVKPNDAKARFVGEAAYVEAGGRIERDLFGSDDDASWTDGDILETLAAKKLEAAAAELAVEKGLAFVTPIVATHVPYDVERQLHEYHGAARALTEAEEMRVIELTDINENLSIKLEHELADGSEEYEVAERLYEANDDELERIHEGLCEPDAETRAQLGTFVCIGNDGALRVHTRLFSERPIRSAPVDGPRKPDEDDLPDTGAKLSVTLMDELATRRCQILAVHVASDPALALDLSIFLMADRIVYSNACIDYGIDVSARGAAFPIPNFRDEGSTASIELEDLRQALDTSWAGFPTMSERFDAFRALDEQARGSWIAYATARSIGVSLNSGDGYRANGFHDHLGRLCNIDVAQWWRPDAENFFGRVKKDIVLDALQDIGGPVLRARYKDAKKAELATACATLCTGGGIVEAEVRAAALAWLPDAMRFTGAEKPKPSQLHTSFREPDVGFEDEDQDDNGDGDADDIVTDTQTEPTEIANDDFEAVEAQVLQTFTQEDAAVLAYVEEGIHGVG
jgi:ParB family chromosome partitioning protein